MKNKSCPHHKVSNDDTSMVNKQNNDSKNMLRHCIMFQFYDLLLCIIISNNKILKVNFMFPNDRSLQDIKTKQLSVSPRSSIGIIRNSNPNKVHRI